MCVCFEKEGGREGGGACGVLVVVKTMLKESYHHNSISFDDSIRALKECLSYRES